MKQPPPIGQYSIRTDRPPIDPADIPPRRDYPAWLPEVLPPRRDYPAWLPEDLPPRLKDARSRKTPYQPWWSGLKNAEKARALFTQEPRRLKDDDVMLADGRVLMSRANFNRIRIGLGIKPLD